MAESLPPRGIAIVGTGAVAQALGRLMYVAGQPVVAIAGRSRRRTADAARFIGESTRPAALDQLPRLADHVLIAVSDNAVAEVARSLGEAGMKRTRGVALHTCGALDPSVLAPLGEDIACGVIHPLQTLKDPEQAVEDLVGAFFMVCGDAAATLWARSIAAAAAGQVLEIDRGQSACYHAAAVMASNAVLASLDAAVRLMELAGIAPARALTAIAPLVHTSVDNALTLGPEAALTGPVVRGDAATVAAHLEAIRGAASSVRELYGAAARHLVVLARHRGLAESSARAIEAALTTSG